MSKKTKKERHPLYNTWAWMRRRAPQQGMDTSWRADFYKFVLDVGPRPSAQFRLRLRSKEAGYFTENCFWKEVISCKDKASRMRQYRRENPEKFKQYELKRMFGLSLAEYKGLLEKQNNVCAICKRAEGFNASLAVDHCHKTGTVRGLLCTNCNRGLGHFKDSIFNLSSASEYLKNTSGRK